MPDDRASYRKAVRRVYRYSGGFTGWYLALAGIGGLVLFSAVYDRCPIYKAISSRLREMLTKQAVDSASQ